MSQQNTPNMPEGPRLSLYDCQTFADPSFAYDLLGDILIATTRRQHKAVYTGHIDSSPDPTWGNPTLKSTS